MASIERMEKLTAILDFSSQQSVYTFADDGAEFDQSYTLTGATAAVQGRDYGYDALGPSAAPVAAGRKTAWRFIHRYGVDPGTGRPENWTSLKDKLTIAFGHGRQVYLQKARPDGTLLIAEARLDSFPDRATTDTIFRADFTVTFTQMEDWKGKDVTSPRYDTGLHYDTGALHYDQRGIFVPIIGALTPFTLTNSGTVAEWGAQLVFLGPIAGWFQLINQSSDVRGAPFLSGTPLALTLMLSLAAGEFLSIDSRTNIVGSNQPGLVPWSVIAKSPGQEYYWGAVPGANSCALIQNGGGAGGSLNIVARSRWRS
jgi:hypothetical protein